MQITVNEPGARTINDSRRMLVEGQPVYVTVGGGTASLIIGGRIVAEQDADTMSTTEAQGWAVRYLAAKIEQDAPVADEAAVAEACDTEQVYAGAVASVRKQADELRQLADKLAAHGDAPYRARNANGRMRTFHSSDPRHPVHAAASHRRSADLLAAWTATDEQGYGRYVSDGLADTDGYFAPIDRAAWKATIGR